MLGSEGEVRVYQTLIKASGPTIGQLRLGPNYQATIGLTSEAQLGQWWALINSRVPVIN
jgi:hypothetical protein